METKVQDKNRDLILDAINPLLKVENIFGFFRFQVLNGRMKKSNKRMKFYALFLISVLFIAYSIIYLSDVISSKQMYINEVVIVLILTLQYVVLIVNVMCSNNKNILIIESLAKIDYGLELSSKNVYNKTRQQAIIFLSVLFCLYTTNFVYECIHLSDYNVYTGVFHHVTNIARHIELVVFYVFVKLIIMRLDILNEYLKQIIDIKSANQSTTYSNNQLSHSVLINCNSCFNRIWNKNKREIVSLAKLFDFVGETTNNLNEVFNYQILNALICTFGFTILLSWMAIQLYFFNKNIDGIISLILQCLFEVSFIGLICYVCEGMNLKRKSTGMLVNKLIMDYDLPRQKRIQAKANGTPPRHVACLGGVPFNNM
ncbi:uncharacterized protein LOC128198691 [Bicyclus anynana]|uniref:Gustatory receptor n=1 Tax=Bicyclus anynana TaxID=110368 RepID=A0ABM3LPW0_BICAN|nr:uncharacterized protein LOC128198691 [Bicyclus anynana]